MLFCCCFTHFSQASWIGQAVAQSTWRASQTKSQTQCLICSLCARGQTRTELTKPFHNILQTIGKNKSPSCTMLVPNPFALTGAYRWTVVPYLLPPIFQSQAWPFNSCNAAVYSGAWQFWSKMGYNYKTSRQTTIYNYHPICITSA